MDKVTDLAAAVRELVPDGARVALGCGLESNIPFAAGYEIARQRRRDLTLIGPISDVLFDLLVGAGCVAEVAAAWVGNVSEGLGHNFRRAAEAGTIRVRDYTNFTIAMALQAAAWGLPHLPARSVLGSEVMADRDGDFLPLRCPFTGERLVAVRAVRPDVTLVHAQRADAQGNAHLWGNLGVTVAAAHAAERVLLTCEELVDPAVIRADPNRTLIPGFLVGAVVVLPHGAHPSPVAGYYDHDDAFYRTYHQSTRHGADAWLQEWVYSLPDHAAYLRRLGLATAGGAPAPVPPGAVEL